MDTSESHQKEIALLQAFLFHYGEPIAEEKAARALGLAEGVLRAAAEALSAELSANPNSGLALAMHEGELQLVTKPTMQDARKRIIEEEWKTELTPAAQETLSLVAYLGPVSKVTIDYIRGVNSGFTLRNLLLRGLLLRSQSETHAHSYDYRVSIDFLRHMGLAKIEDLLDYEKYHETVKNFALAAEGEPAEATPAVTEENGG